MLSISVLSYSGGVQSTALLVLAAQRKVHVDAVVFCDLLQAENPATRAYVYTVAKPYAEQNGLRFIVAEYDLYQATVDNPKTCHIPFFSVDGYKVLNRQCTRVAKIEPFYRVGRQLIRELLKGRPKKYMRCLLGILYDELHRMKDSRRTWVINEYPLVDLRLTRDDCVRIIEEAQLPIPEKSSCWFCPFLSPGRMERLVERFHLQDKLDLLDERVNNARGCKIKLAIKERRTKRDLECDEGYCFT